MPQWAAMSDTAISSGGCTASRSMAASRISCRRDGRLAGRGERGFGMIRASFHTGASR